ncbi:MAG TPA: phosphotransferase [Candidatus Limnocylindrales bacterium]|nr:phosphotransferase [Candidatus Limnocylindrales bacterium]
MYALDDRTVVRRYRRRDVPDEEVAIIQHVRAHGFPTPAVIGVHGRDLILERVDATSMRTDLERDGSLLRHHAAVLAELHIRLHAIAAPPWLARIGAGDAVLHLDLHPENVLMDARGPQLIDWANAGRGDAADDVAQTVVIIAGSIVPEPLASAAAAFVDAFLEAFDRDEVRRHLGAAIARRLADPNMTEPEREAARRVTI